MALAGRLVPGEHSAVPAEVLIPESLRAALAAAGCDLGAVEESFVRSQGAGGQNVNKVATCVMLRDYANKITVKSQKHRTQAANRLAAWVLLLERLREIRQAKLAVAAAAREAVRRRNRPRPAWLRRQFRADKKHRANRRADRQIPSE
jgi:protein subunit release factor B